MPLRLTLRATIVLALLVAGSAGAQQRVPPWKTRLMPWQPHSGMPRPWRDDPQLLHNAPDGFPDDFMVSFQADSAHGGIAEFMWVRVIAYDPATNMFLGWMINRPQLVKGLQVGDNVVFRAPARAGGVPNAVADPDFVGAGWPATAVPEWFAKVREGIRGFRVGDNGSVRPAIDYCIDVLTGAVASIPAAATPEERFVSHFVLGRCLAEKYVTLRALEQFRAAVAIDSNDVDAQMALLAELSVMAHKDTTEVAAADAKRWEREFLDRLAYVRSRFGEERDVQRMFAMIFNPADEAKVRPERRHQIEKLRRIGWGPFRWKRR